MKNMSNRLYQNVISQMKNATQSTIGVLDKNGIIVACSDFQKVGEVKMKAMKALAFSGEEAICEGYTYRFVNIQDKNSVIAFVEGDNAVASQTVQLICVSLLNIKELYDEKYDKNSFIKNIMLDNILPSDVYVKSKELALDGEIHHVVMIIKFLSHTDILPLEIVQSIFADRSADYVVSVGEQDVVLVRQVEGETEVEEFEKLGETVVETIGSEFYAKVCVGISSVTDNIKDLAKAYKEARISLEVGKVFDLERNVLCYESLGIGRLIYQLPITLCDVFMQEVFKKGSLESLDSDTLMTVQSFFKNNLNVSETSRALFVHRNTLVYRLEKIRKITGLDLRKFEHAVTFKVALMVKKYLTNRPTKF